jgi:GAF domain-containing protein
MVVGVLSAPFLIKFYRRITDPIFFKERYDYSEVINKLNEAINREIELDKMLDKTLKIISDALKIKKIVFLLFDDKLKKFVAKKDVGFPVPLQFELSSTSALAQYLVKIKEAVIAEELAIRMEDGVIPDYHHSLAKRVIEKLKEWDVYLCQPVIRQTKLIAIVCVGEKLSSDTFSDEDLRLVNAFANQIVIAMQNFMIYKEIKDKNAELEKNLKLMTGREIKMMELKERVKELERQVAESQNVKK